MSIFRYVLVIIYVSSFGLFPAGDRLDRCSLSEKYLIEIKNGYFLIKNPIIFSHSSLKLDKERLKYTVEPIIEICADHFISDEVCYMQIKDVLTRRYPSYFNNIGFKSLLDIEILALLYEFQIGSMLGLKPYSKAAFDLFKDKLNQLPSEKKKVFLHYSLEHAVDFNY